MVLDNGVNSLNSVGSDSGLEFSQPLQDWSAFESKSFFDEIKTPLFSNFFKNDYEKIYTPKSWPLQNCNENLSLQYSSVSNNNNIISSSKSIDTNFNFKSNWTTSMTTSRDNLDYYYDLSSIWSPGSSNQSSSVSSSFGSNNAFFNSAYYIPPRVRRRTPTCIECVFCKNNGHSPTMYQTHILKDPEGNVLCPVLRNYNCPICNNGGGPRAHTIRYCPKNKPSFWQKSRNHTTRY